MTLLRVVLIGTLLFGIGCELQDENQLNTDEYAQQVGLDEPMSYSSEEALDEETYNEEAFNDEAFNDEALSEEALGDDSLELKPVTCVYSSANEFFAASSGNEAKAREKAREKCERERSRPAECKFRGCS